MVGIGVISWAIWNIRNKVTFDGHKMWKAYAIVFFASSLLSYWVGLHKSGDKELLISREARLMQRTSHPMKTQEARNVGHA